MAQAELLRYPSHDVSPYIFFQKMLKNILSQGGDFFTFTKEIFKGKLHLLALFDS